MSNQHCPGFENNKSLIELKLKCPSCDMLFDIFSDENDKLHNCPTCKAKVDPKTCCVEE